MVRIITIVPENYKLSNFIPLFSIDFGVIMAVRGLMQIPVMFTIIALQGKVVSTLFLFCADFLTDF